MIGQGEMAKASEIFNLLVEKGQLSLRIESKQQHDSLRTRLVRLFSRHKVLLGELGADDGSSALSVCASYSTDSKTSTFRIGKSTKSVGQETIDYEILEEPTSG
jgi:hypothetical protein